MGLNQNTLINECHVAMNKPQLKMNLVKLRDIHDKADKEAVDVIGVCKYVKDLFEGTSRAGKGYKKRDATLVDDSGEAPLTIWGEKAESFDCEGKVIAIKTATISEWNGKSLSVGFGSTLDVEPNIPEAVALR